MCLECGKRFAFLPPHLGRAHGMTSDDYRDRFNIPAGMPLAGTEYRALHREKIRRLQRDGTLDYSHLPDAEKAARRAGRGDKRDFDRRSQAEIMKHVNDSGQAYRKKKAGA